MEFLKNITIKKLRELRLNEILNALNALMVQRNSIVASFVFVAFLLSGCNQEEKSTKQNESTAVKMQKVEVVNPQNRSFTAEVLITGTTGPNQIVTLYAMESGMLMQMRKDIGDKVRQGENIAVLENPEIEYLIDEANAMLLSAEAELISAQAKASAAQSKYDRLNNIFSKTPALTTKADLENAEADMKSSKAFLQEVQARINLARQKISNIKKRKAFLTVKAPFSGVITKRFVDKGAMIQSGLNQSNPQALFELQENNPIRLTIPVPESDAAGIQKGMDVEVTLPEISGKSFTAEVSRTSNALDPMSKTMQVEIDLPNPDGKILSGMYAKALLQLNSRENILSLPMMTKVSHKNEDYVLAVVNGVVKRLPIKIGLSNQDYFEVLNNEITAETQVIVKGKSLVKPEQSVDAILKKK